MESVTGDFFASIPVEACPFAIAPEKLLCAQFVERVWPENSIRSVRSKTDRPQRLTGPKESQWVRQEGSRVRRGDRQNRASDKVRYGDRNTSIRGWATPAPKLDVSFSNGVSTPHRHQR